jgi:hypothetical protein
MPWQRLFLAAATEKNSDDSYRFKTVILSTPRQCGKSSVLLILSATRSLLYPKHKTYFTAQNNMSAYEHVILNFSKQVQAAVFGKKVTTYRGATAPKIIFPNDAIIAPFTPSADGLHGRSAVNLVICDEIFSWTQPQGSGVLGAVQPTQLVAGKRKQLILTSTKGTADSTFLNGWLEKGRKAANDPESTICYFEWSMSPELDPFDMSNFGFHPAVGYTINLEDIAALADTLSKGEYRRSVANLETSTLESVLDLKKWDAYKAVLTTPKRSEVAIAYEVSYDRSKAAIVAAWKDGKTTQTRVIMNGTGTGWLQPALEELADARPMVIGADKYPQNLVISDSLMQDNPDMNLKLLTPEGAKTGAVSFKARIEDGTIRHDGHLALRTAISTAQTRPMGEGWCFSHKSEPELLAAVVACRLLDETKAEIAPMVYFGE